MENQIVWLAEWNNGQDYEDNDDYLIGIYSSKAKANREAKKYHEDKIKNGGTYNPGSAQWFVYRIEVDK
jgi:hypothetical protein